VDRQARQRVLARPARLTQVDAPGGWYAAPPALPDAASGLVSTIDDLDAVTAMLAADGGGLLSADSVRLMLQDRTSERDKAENEIFFGGRSGWGLMMAVLAATPADPGSLPSVPGGWGTPDGYGWDGGSGTTWRTDPATGLTGILLTQRMMTSPALPPVARDFWAAARAACA
jgi:CubicO group peptidase (beta-lactamase class C family)